MAKKKRAPEYKLFVFRGIDDETKQPAMVFLVQTIKQFVNFNYQVLLDVKMEEKRIELSIRGLQAPEISMPAIGPATGTVKLPDLAGQYSLRIKKLGREVNEFSLNFGTSDIRIQQSQPNPFILLSVGKPA